jgi:serine/threonine-protein kinase HipA
MSVAAVNLWGRRVGAVSLPEGERIASFQYDPDFLASGIQLAPLSMPLREAPYTFPGLAPESFHGLPGLLADSLPDRYGNALIDAWLAGQGRAPGSFDVVERLCYVGQRGMGALEYEPSRGPRANRRGVIQVAELVRLASEVLAHRKELVASLAAGHRRRAMQDILSVGTSAGGARAKAVIAYNPETQEVRSGQVDVDPGFEHWLLKLDGVENNKDKEGLGDPQGYGAVEYAYHRMAVDAGITMMPCQLLEENGRQHFMTRRFDRDEHGSKRHMLSLGTIAHYDFNQAGAHSYEQAFMVLRQLHLDIEARTQQLRRLVFNVVARNQDDHVKNIAFLMDPNGTWRLSPAFDVTYAYSSHGPWTSSHQMTINGKRDNFTMEDISAVAAAAGFKRGSARRIVLEIAEIVSRWPEYAEAVGVQPEHERRIQRALRLNLAT